MPIELVGTDLPDDYRDAINAGISAMGVPDPTVVVTSDFDNAVRELTGLSTYSSYRGAGVVAAKTIEIDGGPVILVNAPKVIGDRTPADLERLLAHECGHVILINTDEVTGGHDSLFESHIERVLMYISGYAIEEFRIERRMYELGYQPTDSSNVDHLVEALYINNVDLIIALTDPESADVEKLEAAALAIVDRFAKLLAYMAAPVIALDEAFDRNLLAPESRDHWDDYVGSTWDQRISLYQQIPSVAERIDSSQWATFLEDGAQLESAFMEKIGFYYEVTGGGGYGFWRVNDDAMFHRRARRAEQEVRARETAPE